MGEQGWVQRADAEAVPDDRSGGAPVSADHEATVAIDVAGGQTEVGWQEVAPGVHARARAAGRLLSGGTAPPEGIRDARPRVREPGRGGRNARLAGRRGLWALAAAVFVVVMGIGVVQRGPTGMSVAANPAAPAPSQGVGASAVIGSRMSDPGPDVGTGLPDEEGPSLEAPTGGAAASASAGASAGASASPTESDSAAPTGKHGAASVEDIDWWSVLAELDARRSAALESLDLAALDTYAVVDSPAWRADADLVTDLQGREVRPSGLSTRLIAVQGAVLIDGTGTEAEAGAEVEAGAEAGAGTRAGTGTGTDAVAGAGAGAVQLVIVDRRAAYTLVDAAGEVVQEVPEGVDRTWRMLLQRAEDSGGEPGWRVRSVEESP